MEQDQRECLERLKKYADGVPRMMDRFRWIGGSAIELRLLHDRPEASKIEEALRAVFLAVSTLDAVVQSVLSETKE